MSSNLPGDPSYTVDASRATGVAIGDRAQVIQHIGAIYNIVPASAEHPRLTATLKSRFRPVLEQRHTLFGGRDAELRRIDTFLDEQPAGYLFVTGRSGLGKTALLANWVNAALQRDEAVCYHFISRADGTTSEQLLLRNLCQQLVAFHQLSGDLPSDTEELRVLYADLLGMRPAEGHRLVVVIDGLDEVVRWAPGTDMFPRPLPQNVFVVFSAREMADRDWLTELELPEDTIEVLELEALGATEIADLLRAVGAPGESWVGDSSFLETMQHKSGGDPFYLQYLVRDIQNGLITTLQDLERQPLGVEGYLDKWWEDVSQATGEQAVVDLLAYLLVAKDRLSRSDLVSISNEDALDEWVFERTVRLVDRYVVGDNRAGYALAHPRFQEYMAQEKIGAVAQHRYRERLLAYCGRWREHESRYAMSVYALHLADVQRTDDLHELVAHIDGHLEWAEAHLRVDGSYAGYLRDLDLAWEIARRQGVQAFDRLIRYAVIKSSIRSLSARLPSPLLARLIQTGVWRPATALAHIEQAPLDWQRASLLESIVPLLKGHDLATAWSIARELGDQAAYARVLVALSPYVSVQQQRQILAEITDIDHADTQAYVMCQLLPRLPHDLQQEMLGQISDLSDEWTRGSAVCAVIPFLPPELQEEAFGIAEAIQDERPRAATFIRIVSMLPGSLGLAALDRLLDLSELMRVRAISELGADLAPALCYEFLRFRLGSQSETDAPSAVALADTMLKLLEENSTQRQELIQVKDSVNKALARLNWEQSDELVQAIITHIDNVTQALKDLVQTLPSVEQALIDSANQTASVRLVMALMILGILPEPAPAAAVPGAVQIARDVSDPAKRAYALANVARYLDGVSREEVTGEVLAALSAIADEYSRGQILSILIPCLPDSLRGEALIHTDRIQDPRGHALVLRSLTERWPDLTSSGTAEYRPSLAPAERLRLLAEQMPEELSADVLAAAQAIDEGRSTDELFASLAARTPEVLRQINSGFLSQGLKALVPMKERIDFLYEVLRYNTADSGHNFAELRTALYNVVTLDVRRERHIAALDRLIDELPTPARATVAGDMLAAVQLIGDTEGRANALVAAVRFMPDPPVTEALHAIQEIEDRRPANAIEEALIELGYQVPEARLSEVLDAIAADPDEWRRARVIGALAGILPEDLLAPALAIVRQIEASGAMEVGLSDLVPHLPVALQADALDAIRRLGPKGLATFSVCFSEELKASSAQEAIAKARDLSEESETEWVLRHLASALPQEYRGAVLDAARDVVDPVTRASTLAGIASDLPLPYQFSVLREVLELLDHVPDSWKRRSLLDDIAGGLPDSLYGEALAAARRVPDKQQRAAALCRLAWAMPEAARPALYEEALTLVRQAGDVWISVEGLAGLAGDLPAPTDAAAAQEAWTTVRALHREQWEQRDPKWRIQFVISLARYLPENAAAEAVMECVGLLQAMPEGDARSWMAKRLQDVLQERQKGEVRSKVDVMARWSPRSTRLQVEAPISMLIRKLYALSANDKVARIPEALASIQGLSEYSQKYPLRQLVRHLPDEASPEIALPVIDTIRRINGETERARVLIDLAVHLAGTPRIELICEAMTVAYTGSDISRRFVEQWKTRGLDDVVAGGELLLSTLPELARLHRADLMRTLVTSMPLIDRLYGANVVGAAVNAIGDVGRCWP